MRRRGLFASLLAFIGVGPKVDARGRATARPPICALGQHWKSCLFDGCERCQRTTAEIKRQVDPLGHLRPFGGIECERCGASLFTLVTTKVEPAKAGEFGYGSVTYERVLDRPCSGVKPIPITDLIERIGRRA